MRRIFLALVFLGCAEQAPLPVAAPVSTARQSAAPPAEAQCEHGLLKAVCTKCNPKLIPVFQAKGDWCAEHEFPESLCPICHPERGGRPATEMGADAAPTDGTRIRFKAGDTAQLIGIQTAPAAARAGGAALEAVASLAFDATKQAMVNPRSAGVIREIKADVGTTVQAGDPLAVVESADVGADQSRLRAAGARLKAARATWERESKLAEAGVSARRDAQEARRDLDEAQAEVSAAQAALGMVGGVEGGGRYTLKAPIAGTVIRREAAIGRLVDPGDVLFEIADTRTMWAEIDVPEREALRAHVGQAVAFTFDALPGRDFRGRVEYVAPEVDRHTRTVRARATLDNPEGLLRSNLFGRARLTLGADQTAVMVPREALHRVQGVSLVFVQISDTEFETRRVKTGFSEARTIEVTRGVKPGEKVATVGSFLLKTETLKDSIGAGCCE